MNTRSRTIIALLLSATPVSAFAQADRTVLPVPSASFDGVISESVLDSRAGPTRPVDAPRGAPNILLFMADDIGFAMSSTFGGPVPTPNFDRLAAKGQRFNRFHTTGICSPSRASLLTGRNSHAAGVGFLSDLPAPYPGYGGKILPETATIAQILRLNGYNTAMFGKHHNVPTNERSAAGPFDVWPTGLGFEYFFGFVAGDTDQFAPALYRGITRIEDPLPREDMLDKVLVDDLIGWLHNQKAAASDKPFMVYLAPGSTHAPHQAPAEYIARFKGAFDRGWDLQRASTLGRQVAQGIVPRGTLLSPRPVEIPAWDSLPPQDKPFATRAMEVAAGQLAYLDTQLGRVIDELERMGERDRTIIAVIQGDNGASGEAGPKGTVNEMRTIGTHDEDPAWLAANIPHMGGPHTYGNYPVGWAWAMNAPFPWVKQYASMLGGVRNGMILSWPGHVVRPGSVCARFSHLNDIVPTLLDAAGLPAPRVVLGTPQKPMDGVSLVSSLAACDPDRPRTQYFEVNGKVSLYHDGWYLSGDDGRPSWENLGPRGDRPEIDWRLYDLGHDFSQSADLAANQPRRLAAMQALWRTEAARNNVFPLDHRFGAARLGGVRGVPTAPRTSRFDFWGKEVTLPTNSGPRLFGRSFTLDADLTLDSAAASGVVIALGSRFGGWSLFLDQGHPTLVFARSTDPTEIATVRADKPLPAGRSTLRLRYTVKGPQGGADVVLEAGDTGELARAHFPSSALIPAGGGESLDLGRDLGVPVTDYRTPGGRIEGDISHIAVTLD